MIWKQIGSLSRNSAFWNMSAFHFLTMLTVYAVLGWLPTYLRIDFGYSATEAGIISSLVNIMLALSSPLAGYISDRTGSRTPIMVIGSLLSAVCFAIFIISGNKVLIMISILALGLSMALEILRAHGGRITVESELGEGAAFKLWLRSTLPGTASDHRGGSIASKGQGGELNNA